MSAPYAKAKFSSNNVSAGGNVNMNTFVTHNNAAQQDTIDLWKDHVAHGALHDSAERFDPPKCHPKTRRAVRDLINQWARGSQDGKPVLWLSGAAGAGKSAIAQTLIERWKKGRIPTACFFFWRTSAKRNQKTRLIPTIAFQIAKLFPDVKPSIEAAIRAGDIFERNLQTQMEELVAKPLRDIISGGSPFIVVIDGLDECCVDLPESEDHPGQDHEAQQKEILESLAAACQQSPGLRFFVASRPEREIRQSFGSGHLKAITSHVSLNNFSDANADIRLFLRCKFAEIRSNNPGLDSPWPSEEQVSLLIDKSSGQFIYPSTVINFIARSRQSPHHSLKAVLKIKARPTDLQAKYPLEEIDAVYGLVLGSIDPGSWPIVKDIFGILVYSFRMSSVPRDLQLSNIFNRCSQDTLGFFQHFLFLSSGELHAHLVDVHSILEIPWVGQESQPIRFMHATLSEFLQDQARSQEFFIDEKQYFLRRQLLLQRHVQQSLKDPDLYDVPYLTAVVGVCSHYCPPSKEVRIYLWNLVEDLVGTYSDFSPRSSLNPHPFSCYLAVGDKHNILGYLEVDINILPSVPPLTLFKKCNIPEIESSWWRRLLVRIQLKIGHEKVERQLEREEREWGREESERERERRE